ncbi:hypothetical protein GCM10010176_088200 [Nonomuraea spiralis]|nr:hypothetical protein GCM10010176_088200 [Nonomuraea spiralis]
MVRGCLAAGSRLLGLTLSRVATPAPATSASVAASRRGMALLASIALAAGEWPSHLRGEVTEVGWELYGL